jgi:hypothetical protein
VLKEAHVKHAMDGPGKQTGMDPSWQDTRIEDNAAHLTSACPVTGLKHELLQLW